MSSYWSRMGPKSGVTHPRGSRDPQGGGHTTTVTGTGAGQPPAREHNRQRPPPEAGKRQEKTMHSLEEARPWWQPDLRLASSLQDCKRINFCCFKTPGSWYLVTAALGTYLYSRHANMSQLWQPQGSDTMTSQQRWAYLIPRLSF